MPVPKPHGKVDFSLNNRFIATFNWRYFTVIYPILYVVPHQPYIVYVVRINVHVATLCTLTLNIRKNFKLRRHLQHWDEACNVDFVSKKTVFG